MCSLAHPFLMNLCQCFLLPGLGQLSDYVLFFFLPLPILLMSGMERKRKMSLMVKDNGKMKGIGQATDR
jgi:hypothetical protein